MHSAGRLIALASLLAGLTAAASAWAAPMPRSEQASGVTIMPSATTVRVGESLAVSVTIRVSFLCCLDSRLSGADWPADAPILTLDPATPDQRYGPGDRSYLLQARRPGRATLGFRANGEYAVPRPGGGTAYGPAYADAAPVTITVLGGPILLPVLPRGQPVYRVSGKVCEFPTPSCGAMRGVRLTLAPLGLTTETSLQDGGFAFERVPSGANVLTVSPRCNPYGCYEPVQVIVADADVILTVRPSGRTRAASPK
jgi:hypothetical protein